MIKPHATTPMKKNAGSRKPLGASRKCKSKFYIIRKHQGRTIMTNEMHGSNVSEIEECRAKLRGAGNLVDCLVPNHAQLCDCSLPFGSGYFCKHPRQNEIIENTQKSQQIKFQE